MSLGSNNNFGSLSGRENTPEFLQSLAKIRGKSKETTFFTTRGHVVTKILEMSSTITTNGKSVIIFKGKDDVMNFFGISEKDFGDSVYYWEFEYRLRELGVDVSKFGLELELEFYSKWFGEVVLSKLGENPSVDDILEALEGVKELDIITGIKIGERIYKDLAYNFIHYGIGFSEGIEQWKKLNKEDREAILENEGIEEKIKILLGEMLDDFLYAIKRFLFSNEVSSQVEDLRKKMMGLVRLDLNELDKMKRNFTEDSLRAGRI